MNIINAWLLPDYLSIWTNVGSENIIDDRVHGKFNVLKVLQSGTRELKMYRQINCSINKETYTISWKFIIKSSPNIVIVLRNSKGINMDIIIPTLDQQHFVYCCDARRVKQRGQIRGFMVSKYFNLSTLKHYADNIEVYDLTTEIFIVREIYVDNYTIKKYSETLCILDL